MQQNNTGYNSKINYKRHKFLERERNVSKENNLYNSNQCRDNITTLKKNDSLKLARHKDFQNLNCPFLN